MYRDQSLGKLQNKSLPRGLVVIGMLMLLEATLS